jgi:hypothetical protein
MTGVIAADGTEFIFDSGLKPNGQFWKFNWTKGPIRDHEGEELAYFDGYDVFYVLDNNRRPKVRPKRPGAASKS